MGSVKLIIRVMETLLEAHKKLLDVAKEERLALVNGDMSALRTILYRVNSCTDEIQQLEEERKRLIVEYLKENGHAGSGITVEEILDFLMDEEAKTNLNLIASQLRDVINEIRVINDSNQQLIQSSISYIQYSIGMFICKEPSIGYGPMKTNRFTSLLDAKI
ncbi:flagellar protein FlgN [Neobacillus thermocopriae]|uniref:flagellar protein FlgN n=1 Tax=Neobacillus thermocopriae TaxID=1215031 RepID=UPI002E210744|nr:flagellar protein FlgN [Neobacillus thermocopriae]MED3713799.1 flagellar protein FlgN [Neobacillus thermocopriae]